MNLSRLSMRLHIYLLHGIQLIKTLINVILIEKLLSTKSIFIQTQKNPYVFSNKCDEYTFTLVSLSTPINIIKVHSVDSTITIEDYYYHPIEFIYTSLGSVYLPFKKLYEQIRAIRLCEHTLCYNSINLIDIQLKWYKPSIHSLQTKL